MLGVDICPRRPPGKGEWASGNDYAPLAWVYWVGIYPAMRCRHRLRRHAASSPPAREAARFDKKFFREGVRPFIAGSRLDKPFFATMSHRGARSFGLGWVLCARPHTALA